MNSSSIKLLIECPDAPGVIARYMQILRPEFVARILHRDTVRDMIRKGRDLERMVLAEAVRLHLDDKVLATHGKTVVFD